MPNLYKSVTLPSMSLYLILQFKGRNSAPLIQKCNVTFHVFVSYAAVQGDRIVPHLYKRVTLPSMSLYLMLQFKGRNSAPLIQMSNLTFHVFVSYAAVQGVE